MPSGRLWRVEFLGPKSTTQEAGYRNKKVKALLTKIGSRMESPGRQTKHTVQAVIKSKYRQI